MERRKEKACLLLLITPARNPSTKQYLISNNVEQYKYKTIIIRTNSKYLPFLSHRDKNSLKPSIRSEYLPSKSPIWQVKERQCDTNLKLLLRKNIIRTKHSWGIFLYALAQLRPILRWGATFYVKFSFSDIPSHHIYKNYFPPTIMKSKKWSTLRQ